MYGKWKSINKENQEENIMVRKFKVGDKVKIILKDDGLWNKDVATLIGRTVTIKAFHGYALYKIYEDNGKYSWNNHDFKLVEKEENNTMRYKAGDKVVLKSDLKEWEDYGEYTLQDDMAKNIGQVVKIAFICIDGYELADGTEFCTDEMIDHEATEELNKNKEEANNMKEKYRVGDKIAIRKDLEVDEVYGGLFFEDGMADYMGKVLTIIQVDSMGDYLVQENEDCYFNDEMIDHEKTKSAQRADELYQRILDNLSLTKDDLLFRKSNLKSGHLIRTRDEFLYIFMKNEFGGEDYMLNQKTKGHMELTDYNEDLTFSRNSELDIIEVYEPLDTYALKLVAERALDTSNEIEDKYFKLVYKREEPKEMTLKEIEKQLGYKIKLAKETIK